MGKTSPKMTRNTDQLLIFRHNKHVKHSEKDIRKGLQVPNCNQGKNMIQSCQAFLHQVQRLSIHTLQPNQIYLGIFFNKVLCSFLVTSQAFCQ